MNDRNDWRDPSREKPNEGEEVLLRVSYISVLSKEPSIRYDLYTYHRDGGFKYYEKCHTKESQTKVTHWMRLPKIE